MPHARLALAAAAIAALAPAVAQTTLPVVTAKGHASAEAETPVSMTTLSRDELWRSGAANPGDALRGQPGLAVFADSAQGANPVIRGLKKESIVLLVDGMRLNSAQPQGAVASFLSLALADRLEVVKGASSVLYGTGALGGVVNVLLPQARFEPGLAVRGSLGGETADASLRAAAVLNAGAAAARVDDYEAPGRRVALTGYDSASFIGQYRFRIGARQQLRASLQRHRDDDVWYPGSTKPLANPALGTATIHSPKQQRELAEVGWSLGADAALPVGVDVRLYRQTMERLIWSRANQLNRETAQTTVRFETDGADVKVDWSAHPQHLVTLGLAAWRMNASPERWLASPTPMSPLVRNDPFAGGRIEALGVYAQDDMSFGRLGLVAGLRTDRIEGRADSMGNGAVRSGLARADDATSGSIGVVYEVAPLVRPYANVARGFRAGEMRERFESSPRGDGYFYVGNPQIAPEKSTQIEVGVKGADADLVWSAAAYVSRITDYITGRPTGGVQSGLPVKATVNLGRAEIRGIEAQARWHAGSGQWLRAGVSALRGENKDLDEPLFQMPADELSLGYEGRIGAAWTVDTTLRAVRGQHRVATRFSLGSENATGGFATADVGATWRLNRDHQFRVALKNIADKKYHEHLSEGLSGQENPAPGRSLALSWQGKF